MTLANEMARIAAEFEAAKGARLAAVAEIAKTVRGELAEGRAVLRRTTAEHAKAMESDLKGIFSEAAFIRGTAEDLIDRFADERQDKARTLRVELEKYASDLSSSVDKRQRELASARETMSARETTARQAYIKDLRSRCAAVLADAGKYIEDLERDRMRAGQIWQQHLRSWKKQRRTAPRQAPAAPETAPSETPGGAPSAREPSAAATKPTPDDLTEIRGIGPAMQRRLNALGIETFRDLAAADADKLTGDIKASQPMILKSNIEAWIAAARERA